MANISTLTRKEQVLAYLRARINQWVDGPELATAEVGGSEGLKRLRELRADGHDIRMRKHPDAHRDIWQYRLVTPAAPAATYSPIKAEQTGSGWGTMPPKPPPLAVGPDEQLHPADQVPVPKRLSDMVKRTEDGRFEYVGGLREQASSKTPARAPEPSKPVQPVMFTEDARDEQHPEMFVRMPAKVVYGEVAVCPRCRGKTTRGIPKGKPGVIAKDPEKRRRKMNEEEQSGARMVDAAGIELFRDPGSRKPQPCTRCNGYGIVPNLGPIAVTPPTGPAPATPIELADEAPSEPAFD